MGQAFRWVEIGVLPLSRLQEDLRMGGLSMYPILGAVAIETVDDKPDNQMLRTNLPVSGHVVQGLL